LEVAGNVWTLMTDTVPQSPIETSSLCMKFSFAWYLLNHFPVMVELTSSTKRIYWKS